MRENFEKAFELTVGFEGGYVNDPDDLGRETKYGISKQAHPQCNIPALTLEQAREIYLNEYWKEAGCDTLMYPLDILTFDRAVLHGVRDAREWAAVANSWDDILFCSLQHIVDHWHSKFARGWLIRILRLWKIFDR